MSKFLILCAFILVGIVFSRCVSTPEEAKAVFKQANIDFGSKKQKDTIDVVYTVENAGSADLILLNVSPSCKCTVPSYSKSPIKVNQKGEIRVRFIPKITDEGKIYQEIVVKTNSNKKLQVLT